MKTAISIPDDLFSEADRLARLRRVTRSQIYAEALRDYLARYGGPSLTDAIDASLAALDQAEDRGFLDAAARKRFGASEWE